MQREYMRDSFGEVIIKGIQWYNNNTPSYVMVLAPGMAETIERYNEFADTMVQHGLYVYGHSHRGQGKTACSTNLSGDLKSGDWLKMKSDLQAAINHAAYDYPACPLIVLGHSMGSFLVRDLIQDGADDVDGVILSGTSFFDPLPLVIGKWIAGLEILVHGQRHRSKRLYRMTFGAYNQHLESPQTPFDWLTRDHEQVEKYRKDPSCGQIHTSRFYKEFFSNLHRILYKPVAPGPKHDLPLLLLSGGQDPVGSYGEGVIRTQRYYEKQGLKTTLKLYPDGRHEMLNEINRQEVYMDIINWIQTNITVGT
jgi:alpha-beta hydrolase superfamily lysophospholipase